MVSYSEILQAAEHIRAGRLVAFPTETVYGLGADATSPSAVALIYEAKARPRFNPLIAHVTDLTMASDLAVFDALSRRLGEAIWPGPLTIVLPKTVSCPVADLATAGLATIAVRAPDHRVAQALVEAAGRPIVAPSANRSGHVSATTADHVRADLGGRVSMILDDGPSPGGLESTIVRAGDDGLTILRDGGLSREVLAEVAGIPVSAIHTVDRSNSIGRAPTSPGQLESHYAPQAAVRLNAMEARPGEALLAFGPDVPDHSGPIINLSPSGDLREAAARLFAAMRELDATGLQCIAAMPIPERSLGIAINDRLRRAAAPRH